MVSLLQKWSFGKGGLEIPVIFYAVRLLLMIYTKENGKVSAPRAKRGLYLRFSLAVLGWCFVLDWIVSVSRYLAMLVWRVDEREFSCTAF